MRKALFLYNGASGKGKTNRHLPEILARLEAIFDVVDVFKTSTMEEGMEKAKQACGVYDVLVFRGGDGTFNHIVSALYGMPNPPIMGYINGGTISDIGRNFGIKGNVRHALSIIEGGHTCGFDLGLVNGEVFTYMAAVGAYADIAYVTKRKYKKRIGRIAYYFKAIAEALRWRSVPCVVEAGGERVETKVPFLLCLSGKNVGGFRVNARESNIHDGKMEMYLTKPGLFNGLLHYLFFKVRTTKIVASEFHVQISYPEPWCLDGERGPSGDVHIKTVDSGLRIFCAEKFEEPLE
ncbi:MAG: hypothetical protein K6E59_00955 [Bacilli bacterium]|nr:hypothetical protein [Bacilli bacterium]